MDEEQNVKFLSRFGKVCDNKVELIKVAQQMAQKKRRESTIGPNKANNAMPNVSFFKFYQGIKREIKEKEELKKYREAYYNCLNTDSVQFRYKIVMIRTMNRKRRRKVLWMLKR